MVDVAGVGPALVDYINTIEAYPPIGGHAVIKSSSRMPGGAAGNVIYALSGFGLKCRFYTTIGEDEDGRFYIDEMTKKGVEVKYNITHPLTGRCTIFVDSNGERTFFVQPNASGVLNEGLKSEIVFGLKECDYIYLDPFPSADSFAFHLDVAKEAEKHECKVVLNPGYPYSSMGLEKLKKILNHCSILFLSEFELKVLKADVEIVASMVDLLVVTLGRKGSMAISGGKKFQAKAFEVNTVDTTGAGDAFAAGFLYAHIKGYGIEKSLLAGNFSASKNVVRVGARNFPEKREIDDFLRELEWTKL